MAIRSDHKSLSWGGYRGLRQGYSRRPLRAGRLCMGSFPAAVYSL